MHKAAWQWLWQEVDHRLVTQHNMEEKPVKEKGKRAARVVDLTDKPIILCKPPKATISADDSNHATSLVRFAGGVEIRKPIKRTREVAGDEADLADAESESSGEAADVSSESDSEDDNSDCGVIAVCGRRGREKGLEYLVQLEGAREGDGEVWVTERHLDNERAKEAIRKYEMERSNLQKRFDKQALKEIRGVAHPDASVSRTRLGRTK